MYQEIIAAIIIATTIFYAIYAIIKSLTKKDKGICDGESCSNCSIKKELKNLPKVKEFNTKVN